MDGFAREIRKLRGTDTTSMDDVPRNDYVVVLVDFSMIDVSTISTNPVTCTEKKLMACYFYSGTPRSLIAPESKVVV
jgi:hypothetical protein